MNTEYDFYKKNRGKILLAAVFAVFGILFMTIGFLKTLFVVFFAAIGFFAGYLVDDKEMVRRFINIYLGK